jgi:hypothetical protein
MLVNMFSFDISKGFQYKCNCLESLKTKRVRKTTRSIENHKTMKSPGNQEIQEVRKSQESPQKSKKNPEPQESGRLADYNSQDPGE